MTTIHKPFTSDEEVKKRKGTGVFMSEDNRLFMDSLVQLAQNTVPMVTWVHVYKKIHEFALEDGLPEIKGYYGMDGRTGEYMTGTPVDVK